MKSSISLSSFVEEIMFLGGDVNICEKCAITEDDYMAVEEVMTVTDINISESVSDSGASVNEDISATAGVTSSELILACSVGGTVGYIQKTTVNETMVREDSVNICAKSSTLPEFAETGRGYAFGTSDTTGESNSNSISDYSTISDTNLNSSNGVECCVKRQPTNVSDRAEDNVVNNMVQKMMGCGSKCEFSNCQASHCGYAHDQDKTCVDNVGSEYDQNVVGFKDSQHGHDPGVSVACNICHLTSSNRGTFSSSSQYHNSSHLESQSSLYPGMKMTGETLESLSYELNNASVAKSCHGNCDCSDCCSPGASHYDIIQHQMTSRDVLDVSDAATVDMIFTCASSKTQNVLMNYGFGQQVSVSLVSEVANAGEVCGMKVSVHYFDHFCSHFW